MIDCRLPKEAPACLKGSAIVGSPAENKITIFVGNAAEVSEIYSWLIEERHRVTQLNKENQK